jgi:hypothetical protein
VRSDEAVPKSVEKMRQIKMLLEEGLITEKDYETTKSALLLGIVAEEE